MFERPSSCVFSHRPDLPSRSPLSREQWVSVQATGWRRHFNAKYSIRDMGRKLLQWLKAREREDRIAYRQLGFNCPQAFLVNQGGVLRTEYLLGLREMQTFYLLSPDIDR